MTSTDSTFEESRRNWEINFQNTKSTNLTSEWLRSKLLHYTVSRSNNKYTGWRFHRNYEIHIFNSHTLFQLSYSATLKPRVYPTLDCTSSRSHLFFRHHARAQLFSHTSLSFVLSSAVKYLRSHRTTLILSLSPHSSFHTNIMYFHSSMVTTTTYTPSFANRAKLKTPANTVHACKQVEPITFHGKGEAQMQKVLQQFDRNYARRYDRHSAAITRLDRARIILLANRFHRWNVIRPASIDTGTKPSKRREMMHDWISSVKFKQPWCWCCTQFVRN